MLSDKTEGKVVPPGRENPRLVKPRVIVAVVAVAAALGAGAVWAATTTSPFPDVPTDHPRVEAIRYAKAEGLFLGFADGNLRPDAELSEGQFTRTAERLYDRGAWTRADWAQVLFSGLPSLAAASAAPAGAAPFPDVPGDHPRVEAIRYAKAEGLFLGYPDGTLRPDTDLSGGQFAKTAKRLYDRYDVWTRADWAQVLFGGLPTLAPAAETTTTTAPPVASAAPTAIAARKVAAYRARVERYLARAREQAASEELPLGRSLASIQVLRAAFGALAAERSAAADGRAAVYADRAASLSYNTYWDLNDGDYYEFAGSLPWAEDHFADYSAAADFTSFRLADDYHAAVLAAEDASSAALAAAQAAADAADYADGSFFIPSGRNADDYSVSAADAADAAALAADAADLAIELAADAADYASLTEASAAYYETPNVECSADYTKAFWDELRIGVYPPDRGLNGRGAAEAVCAAADFAARAARSSARASANAARAARGVQDHRPRATTTTAAPPPTTTAAPPPTSVTTLPPLAVSDFRFEAETYDNRSPALEGQSSGWGWETLGCGILISWDDPPADGRKWHYQVRTRAGEYDSGWGTAYVASYSTGYYNLWDARGKGSWTYATLEPGRDIPISIRIIFPASMGYIDTDIRYAETIYTSFRVQATETYSYAGYWLKRGIGGWGEWGWEWDNHCWDDESVDATTTTTSTTTTTLPVSTTEATTATTEAAAPTTLPVSTTEAPVATEATVPTTEAPADG